LRKIGLWHASNHIVADFKAERYHTLPLTAHAVITLLRQCALLPSTLIIARSSLPRYEQTIAVKEQFGVDPQSTLERVRL
jgi:hypothetical protein